MAPPLTPRTTEPSRWDWLYWVEIVMSAIR